MYEPYGEKRRFNIDWTSLKEKFKNLKLNKTLVVILAVIALGAVGGITGLVSYTSKVTEMNSKLLVRDRQLDACQSNVTSCLTDLSSAKDSITTLQTESTKCKVDMQNKETELQGCQSDNENLNANISQLTGTVGEWKSKYENLMDDYTTLENKQTTMERNYAKSCCNFGFSYYFLKDDTRVVCCSKNDINSCGETPPSADVIKAAC
jgi:chromosome segregation ATPase